MTRQNVLCAGKTGHRKVFAIALVFSAMATVYGTEVSLQTDTAAYHRLTATRLTVPIDWSWEWLPSDAVTATVTLTGTRSGLLHTTEVSDRSCNEVVIPDFGGSWSVPCDDSIAVELAFTNAVGDIARKSYVYEFMANPAVSPLHKGIPGDAVWRREFKTAFSVPFDASWFGRRSDQMTLTLTDASDNTTQVTVDASAGRFVFPGQALAPGLYRLAIQDAARELASCEVDLIPTGFTLRFM